MRKGVKDGDIRWKGSLRMNPNLHTTQNRQSEIPDEMNSAGSMAIMLYNGPTLSAAVLCAELASKRASGRPCNEG